MNRKQTLFALMMVLALVISACAPATTTPAPAAQPTQPPAAQATQPPAAQATQPPAAPAPTDEPMLEMMGAMPMVNPLEVSGDIISAGSSTVFPLTEAMAERFEDEGYAGKITIDSIGSGAGLERFCVTGETDIANASRAIKGSEVESCRAIGREPVEFRVGTDALAVTVNPANTFLDEGVTLEELAKIFSDEATTWAEVNPAWPAEPMLRFSPGTDSGTFDYFVEAVMDAAYGDEGEAKILATAGIQLSEDDNVLVQGVEGDANAIGYFGYAYYVENADRLKILKINGVEASGASVDAGTYPLARPLFIYSDAKIMAEKPQVADFINFYLTYVNDEIDRVGYFPASDSALGAAKVALLDALSGMK
jgi:phosphate binding protein